MKSVVVALLLSLAVTLPAASQGDPAPDPDAPGEGADLLGEGARTFLRGLLDGVEPGLRDLQRKLDELNWQGLTLDDLDVYHAPEVFPNGDILLRRKDPDPLPPLPEGPQIDI